MDSSITRLLTVCSLIIGIFVSGTYAKIKILQNNRDPYGYPRPMNGEIDVPTGTSFFFELNVQDEKPAKPVEASVEAQVGGFDLAQKSKDEIDLDSITVSVHPEGSHESIEVLLNPGKKFGKGCSGSLIHNATQKSTAFVYIDNEKELKPSTIYYIAVGAKSRDGQVLSRQDGQWKFTTEPKTEEHKVNFGLDFSQSPVRWHGGFFTGFVKTSFCTSSVNRMQSYELMDSVRKNVSPKAWSVVRDIHLATEHQPADNIMLIWALPNIMRERETRRITTMKKTDDGVLLTVEDFFGHEQYGIESKRPLASDYHPGDEVLIADGISDARAKVIKVVDDSGASKTLLVSAFKNPAAGWKISYAKSLPEKEDPRYPGLFPAGGCYLRKFNPAGTPHYYWGRLDKEWDIHNRQFGRRIMVNVCDAQGDSSIDGQNWNRPKDYAEHHKVVYDLSTHEIDRYGKATMDFYWSVFNEVDLAASFWRCRDWNEMQKFYDYTVDAVCRAFEDRGYDSNNVLVGGLELGGIFGTNLEQPLRLFLIHCSPTATGKDALPQNAVFIDKRLDGKRSKRLENLCAKTGGKGSPCNFISVHTYNASPLAAAKLITAKKIALEVDPAYYADLWVNSGESCPGWSPPGGDKAAEESYTANGFWTAWSADFARRLLAQTAIDKRYGFGESFVSVWPWPNRNFETNLDNETRLFSVDDDGDGRKDREQIIAEPILYFVGLMASMGDDYVVLPEQKIAGSVVSGYAAKKPDAVNVLLYAHNPLDTQSRSKQTYNITLDINDIPWKNVKVKEYGFDKDKNSYYRLAMELRGRPAKKSSLSSPDSNETKKLLATLRSSDPNVQIAAVEKLLKLGDVPQEILVELMMLHDKTQNPKLRDTIMTVGQKLALGQQVCYSAKDVARLKDLSTLHTTKESNHKVGSDGKLRLPFTVAVNGADFVVIEPAQ